MGWEEWSASGARERRGEKRIYLGGTTTLCGHNKVDLNKVSGARAFFSNKGSWERVERPPREETSWAILRNGRKKKLKIQKGALRDKGLV